MKISLRKNLKLAFLIALPLILFAMLRDKASWRPQVINFSTSCGVIAVSLTGQFVACTSNDSTNATLLQNLSNGAIERRWSTQRKIFAMEFSPDEKILAMAWTAWVEYPGVNYTKCLGVTLWNGDSEVRELEIVTKNLGAEILAQLRFSPDGKTIWLASSGNLRAWTVADGKLQWQWRNKSLKHYVLAASTSGAISPDCRFYFRYDGESYLAWDIAQKKPVLQHKGANFYGESLIFSPDASLAMYVAKSVGENVIIDTRTGRRLWRIAKQFNPTFAGDKFVFTQNDKFKVCNARTGKFLYELPAKPQSYTVSAASKDWLFSRQNNSYDYFRQRFR